MEGHPLGQAPDFVTRALRILQSLGWIAADRSVGEAVD
jgi:hypothetical protein